MCVIIMYVVLKEGCKCVLFYRQREFEFYSDARNCTTALENRYNRDITRLKSVLACHHTHVYLYTYACITQNKSMSTKNIIAQNRYLQLTG